MEWIKTLTTACPNCGKEDKIVVAWGEGDHSVGIGAGVDIIDIACGCDLNWEQEEAITRSFHAEDFQP